MYVNDFFFQFLLQSYSAGFNHANRNSSSEQVLHSIHIQILSYEILSPLKMTLICMTHQLIFSILICLQSNVLPLFLSLSLTGSEDVFEAVSVDRWDSFLCHMCRGVYDVITYVVFQVKKKRLKTFLKISCIFYFRPFLKFSLIDLV